MHLEWSKLAVLYKQPSQINTSSKGAELTAVILLTASRLEIRRVQRLQQSLPQQSVVEMIETHKLLEHWRKPQAAQSYASKAKKSPHQQQEKEVDVQEL